MLSPRTFFRVLAIVVTLPAAGSVFAMEESTERPPNVVLIFADDLGYGDLGCYGATKIQTPNIDRLAREGRRFTDAHSASAVCTPSRYGLLTGEYPMRALGGKGVWGPLSPLSELIVDTETLTIGKVFQNKGYATACMGKWHLGFKRGKENDWKVPLRPGPQDVGFDHYFGVPLVNSGSPFVYVEDDTIVGHDPDDPLSYGAKQPSPTPTFPEEASRKSPNRFGGALKAHQIYDDEKTGKLLTERAVQWIGDKKDQPFFLYFPTPNIHHPFTPDPRFKGTSQCGLYGDFTHELDWMVGEVMKALDEHGLTENTLVIFTSDNGGMMNLGGRNAAKAGHKMNGDLLGFKFGGWEGGHRVPFIARWPGKIQPATESKQLLSQIDMLATFLALTDQEEQSLEGKDSINMLPALLDDPQQPLRTELLIPPRSAKHLAYRKGKWLYMNARGSGGFRGSKPEHHAWGGPPAVALVGGKNSEIEAGKLKKGSPKGQLYDLERDPSQTTNLYREYPDVVKQMKAALEPWRTERNDTKKKKSPPKKLPKQTRTSDHDTGYQHVSVSTPLSSLPGEAHRDNAAAASDTARSRPNIIFMLTDDLGYSDVGCYGAQKVKTPHIDRLAEQGIRFTNFHTGSSICSPSRAAFLTGAYPQRAGLYMGINPKRTAHWFLGLHPEEITIAEQLKSQNYSTHMVGKWHLGTEPEFLPQEQGFDTYYGMPCNYGHSPRLFDNDKVVFEKTPLNRLTQLYTQRVTRIIQDEAKKDAPFFLYFAHNYPHTPYKAGKNFKGSSQDGVRGDVMQELDWGVGEMMKALQENGIADNTIVIFTSDNGPTKNQYAKPYRGTKFTTFEGGHRVPFIVHWPRTIETASVSNVDVNAMDLFPTLCDVAAASMPNDRVYDGESLMPLLNGHALSRQPDTPFLYYNCENLQAVRIGDWKLHLPRKKKQLPFWDKNQAFVGVTNPVLYNLATDVGERLNVAAEHPDVTAQLSSIAKSARNELGEFMQRGTAQRPTGSLFPNVPVISHEKDWQTIDSDTATKISIEQKIRHPAPMP